jgi:formyl-CoA transferase
MELKGQSDLPRPLAGVKVLEMGQLLAGPFAAALLAWFGAEVIKIEPPGQGDPPARINRA